MNTDTENNPNTNNSDQVTIEAEFLPLFVYSKTTSSAVLNGPQSFLIDGQLLPRIHVEREVLSLGDDVYEVTLVCSLAVNIIPLKQNHTDQAIGAGDDHVREIEMFSANIREAGVFKIVCQEFALEQKLNVVCAQHIYPFALTKLLGMCNNSGLPRVDIAYVDFEKTYWAEKK